MIGAMHMAAFLITAVLAAIPAYYVLRRTDEGRARGAIAYLSGFFFGITAFLLLPTRDPVLAQSALLAAVIGPVFGMMRARYMRQRRERAKQRRKARRGDVAQA
jgi:peptidoglycan/LPS O-acetylase OafA/YrhL